MNHVDSFQIFEGKRDGLPVLNSDQKWFLKKVTRGKGGYTINPETKKIDVETLDMFQIPGGSVREEMTPVYKSLTEIGFGVCKKDFILVDLLIEDLKGSPEVVGGNFRCHYCGLRTIEGGPKRVEGNFVVSEKNLRNLKGSPEYVGGLYDFGFQSLGFTLDGLTPLDKIGVELGEDDIVLQGRIENGDHIQFKKRDMELPKILNLYRLTDSISTQEMLYTLITPEKIQEYIDENPERFVTGFLPKIWDHVIKMKGYENLKVPQKYQEEFDDFSDLSKLGF